MTTSNVETPQISIRYGVNETNDQSDHMAAWERGFNAYANGKACPKQCPRTEGATTWWAFCLGWSYAFYSKQMREANHRFTRLSAYVRKLVNDFEAQDKPSETQALYEKLRDARMAAVGDMDFDSAATLRDLENAVMERINGRPPAEPEAAAEVVIKKTRKQKQ